MKVAFPNKFSLRFVEKWVSILGVFIVFLTISCHFRSVMVSCECSRNHLLVPKKFSRSYIYVNL